MNQQKHCKKHGRIIFTKAMKKTHKLLIPNMLPIHFELIKNILRQEGYDCDLLKSSGSNIVKMGLENVHNDTCYPCLLVVGQFIDALESGKYDKNKTALLITQTGGGCRASNYIHLLRKALKRAGYPQVPVISVNLSGLEKNPGFKLSFRLIKKLASALMYGDMLMLLENQTKPHEQNKGDAEKLTALWIKKMANQYKNSTGFGKKIMSENFEKIVKDYSEIKIKKTPKVKVGIVGEIYVKYSPLANNNLQKFLEDEGVEVAVPGIMDFIIFKVDNRIVDIDIYGGSKIKRLVCVLFKKYLENIQNIFIQAIKKSGRFSPPSPFEKIKTDVGPYIGYGAKMGEGWLLTAEMIELIKSKTENIVCAQPFGCLPNHIVGKGMVRAITKANPNANIVCVDYDPGATRVNQENRIKLMLSTAKERFNEKSHA